MKHFKRNAGIFILLICMVFSVFVGCASSPETEGDISSSSEWMKDVAGETKLSSISIPGTHDTCTNHVGMSYIFQCQDTDIATQLRNGYRYLDMRLALSGKGDKQTLILKHNFSKCKKTGSLFSRRDFSNTSKRRPSNFFPRALTLNDVLADVYSFLEEHPTETVIMCMKAENGKDDVAEVQKILYDAIGKNEDVWYLSNKIPTLDEVRGKIVLATRFEDKMNVGDSRSGMHFYWDDQGDRTIVDV